MRLPMVCGLLFAVPLTPACCGVGMGGARVVFTGQTNIVVWDSAHGVEHFVRDAHFETNGASLGFIAPTPGKPTLSAVDAGVFDVLSELNPNPTASASETKRAMAMAPQAGAVEVIETKDVAGYRATVLRATDGKLLAGWLKANGYASPSFLARWVAPYVAKGWYLTAFKVNGDATGPIRMSFPTDQPFNPYSVPKENGGKTADLRLFYVSAGRETPKVGGTGGWRNADWTVNLPEETAGRIAHDLRLAPDAIPAGARVTEYQDPHFGTPGLDDLYFVTDTPPYRSAVGVGAVAVVLMVGVLRQRRRA